MKYTANYELNKPERTDFFSIEHQNKNMDKVDEALAGKADQGDIYTKEEVNSHLSNKANKSDFTYYKMTGENQVASGQDCDSLPVGLIAVPSHAIASTMYHTPSGLTSSGLIITETASTTNQNVLIQTWKQRAPIREWRRYKDTVNGWSNWVEFATAIPPQKYTLPLSQEFSAYHECIYWKDQSGIVHVQGAARKSSTITLLEIFATLPTGYRPTQTQERPASYYGSDSQFIGATVIISTNGNIRVPSKGIVNKYGIYFDLCFLTQ